MGSDRSDRRGDRDRHRRRSSPRRAAMTTTMPRTRRHRLRRRRRRTPSAAETTVADTAAPDTAATGTEPTGTEATAAGGGEVTFPCRSARPRSRASRLPGATTATPRPDASRCGTSSRPSATPRSKATTAATTAPGVTADSIKVVYYPGPDDDPIVNYLTAAIAIDDTNADRKRPLTTMRDCYEQFYELYGRTVDLQFFQGSGDHDRRGRGTCRCRAHRRGDPALRRARRTDPHRRVRRRTLVARHLVHRLQPGQPPEWYADRDPYTAAVPRSAPHRHVHSAGVPQQADRWQERRVRRRRASRPSRASSAWCTSSPVPSRKRSTRTSSPAPHRRGIEIVEPLPYQLDPGTIQSQASQIIAKLKASNVTTVIFSRRSDRPATSPGRRPHRSTSRSGSSPSRRGVDVTAFARTYDQQQWQHAFGVQLALPACGPRSAATTRCTSG